MCIHNFNASILIAMPFQIAKKKAIPAILKQKNSTSTSKHVLTSKSCYIVVVCDNHISFYCKALSCGILSHSIKDDSDRQNKCGGVL